MKFLDEAHPMSATDEELPVGAPGPSSGKLTSPQLNSTSSDQKWDSFMTRLAPNRPRSTTPEIDLVHPKIEGRRTGHLESKPGFFGRDNAYLSHWECCQCKIIHPITDKNKTQRSMRDPLLTNLRATNLISTQPCATPANDSTCLHHRCDGCYDLDPLGYRRQYSSGEVCARTKTAIGPLVASTAPPAPAPMLTAREMAQERNRRLAALEMPMPQTKKRFDEGCHRFTWQEGFVPEKEKLEIELPEELPMRPWKGLGKKKRVVPVGDDVVGRKVVG